MENRPGDPTAGSALSAPDFALSSLAWGLFWRMICAQAAPLFLFAAVVCFFAFNWAAIPAFGKFGLIGALMLAAVALALWRGIESTAGSLGLLACGLLAGPLLAVFGQTYQTGADPWELFRAWTLFLLPLALAGRQNGLWLALWITGSLWAGLYLNELSDFSGHAWENMPYPLYLALMQTAALIVREAASFFLSGPQRPFLRARWFPRLMAFPLMAFLTCTAASQMLFGETLFYGPGYLILLLFLLVCGGAYYTQKKRDTVMISCGLMSLTTLGSVLPLMGVRFHYLSLNLLAGHLFLVALILVGGAAASVKILMAYQRQSTLSSPPESSGSGEEALRQTSAAQPAPQDAARAGAVPEGGGRPFPLSSVYAPRLAHFALTGALPEEKKTDSNTARSGASPWPATLLVGMCAWIAALFLLAAIILIVTSDADEHIMLSVFVLLAGAALSWTEGGVFKRQISLCLALAGTLGAGGLIEYAHPSAFSPFALPVLFAIGYRTVNNAVYRFFAAAVGVPALALAVFPGFLDLFFRHSFRPALPLFKHPLIPAAFFTLLCALPAHFQSFAPAGRENAPCNSPYWRPLLLGWLAALLVMGAATLVSRMFPSFHMIGAGAGLGLVWFSFRLSGRLGLSLFSRAALIALSAAAAAVSLRLPWFGAGLFVLALARQMQSLPFVGLAILFLAGCVNLEYYNLGTSLLNKSLSLAAIGLLLLAAALGLHGLLAAAIRRGRLPDLPPALAGRARSTSVQGDGVAPHNVARPAPPAPGRIRIPRKGVVFLCIMTFFLLFSWAVLQKERLLAGGDSVILALRPVDPRSLMQGDYMILRFALEDEIERAMHEELSDERTRTKGVAVVEPGPDGAFRFKRLDDGSPLAAGEKRLVFRVGPRRVRVGFGTFFFLSGEKRLVFRSGPRSVQVGSGAFFFQEGHGPAYGRARFALLRVDESGNCLITRLLDEQKTVIRPEEKPKE